METYEQLKQSRDQLRAEVSRLQSVANDMTDGRTVYLQHEMDEVCDALLVAEGALKRAKPYVAWSDNEGRQESDYPDASAIVKADKECVDQAIARIAAMNNQ